MFQTRLKVEDVPPNLWRLAALLIWDDSQAGGAFGRVEFPAGSVTDLGSTPQTLRRFRAFDPTGPSRRGAVGHDYLYQHARWPDGRPCTRAQADTFLRAALVADGVSSAVAWMWWRGVRLGGWLPWKRYRQADADWQASYNASAGDCDLPGDAAGILQGPPADLPGTALAELDGIRPQATQGSEGTFERV